MAMVWLGPRDRNMRFICTMVGVMAADAAGRVEWSHLLWIEANDSCLFFFSFKTFYSIFFYQNWIYKTGWYDMKW